MRGGWFRRLAAAMVVWGAALGGAGSAGAGLLVLSQDGTQVLAYDATSGAFDGVFADTITEGFRNPVSLAVRAADGKLYVPSTVTGEIWSYTASTAQVVTPAVATGLFSPTGVAFDASEAFLYFADQDNVDSEFTDTVKRLEIATGTVSSVGTDVAADFQGLAVNGSNVFATDVETQRVLRFPVSGGSGTAVISSGLDMPAALLFPTPTQMLVADLGSDRVLEYTLSMGSWSFSREVLPASAGVIEPCGLALAPDGRLTVTGRQSNDAVLVDLTTLAVTPLVAPGAGGLSTAGGADWNGASLLVASILGNAVLYYDASGDPTGLRAEGVSPALEAGIELSADGSTLWVGSSGGNAVLEYDVASGALLRTFSGACPTFAGIFDVALGPSGDLYVSCTFAGSVTRFDGATATSLGSFVFGLSTPRGLAFGPNGNLFVSNGLTGEVREFDGGTGAFVGTFIDSGGNGGGPVDPWGLLFHGGSLFVVSNFPDEVREFDDTTGAYLSTFVASGSGGLVDPTSLSVGPGGDLFVASRGDDAIRRYAGSNGAYLGTFVASGSGGLDAPFDLAFTPDALPPKVPALGGSGGTLLVCLLFALGARAARPDRGRNVGRPTG